MEIPELHECNLVLVFAPVSSGKTHLLRLWTNSLERSLTIDTTAECMDDSYTHIWGSPKSLYAHLMDNPFYYRIAYHPNARNFETDFNYCVEGIWLSGTINQESQKITPLPRWLIVDEVHEVCSNHSILEKMELIIRYARHNLLGFIGTTQRISDVNRLMTSNARMVILFHTTEPIDCDAIRERYGKNVEQEVRNLRPLIYDEVNKVVEQEPQCLVWTRGRGTKIYSLGNKIKGEKQQCEPLEVQQRAEAQPSLEHHSGNKEKPLSEPIEKNGSQQ